MDLNQRQGCPNKKQNHLGSQREQTHLAGLEQDPNYRTALEQNVFRSKLFSVTK